MDVFANMKLRTRILGLVAILLTFMVGVAVYAALSLSAIGEELKQIAEDNMPLTKKITGVEAHYMGQLVVFERMLRFGELMSASQKSAKGFDKSEKEFEILSKEVDEEVEEAVKISKKALEHALTDGMRQDFTETIEMLEAIAEEHHGLEKHILEVFEQFRHGKLHEAHQLAEEVEEEEEQLKQKIIGFMKHVEELTEQSILAAEHEEERALQVMSVLTLVALVLGGFLGILIAGNIFRQLGCEPSDIAEITQKISDGDLAISFDAISKRPEGALLATQNMVEALRLVFGGVDKVMQDAANGIFTGRVTADVNGAFDTLKNNVNAQMDGLEIAINDILRVSGAMAKGELRQRVDVDLDGSLDDLKENLNTMIVNVSNVVGNISSAAGGVATGSEQLNDAASQISQGATEQASSVEETSSAMEEMSANIQQNADNAQQTGAIAEQSAKNAEESGQAVVQTVQAMKEIAGKIVIIQEIAEQTNLLALNAAIEAARAGDHGKGFAVVAAEVRKLAERSQDAAAEINTLSSASVQTAEKAGGMLASLVPEIKRTAELVQEIRSASHEQNQGAAQINQAVQQLDQVIQQNAGASEEMSGMASSLQDQAGDMQRSIRFFKIDEEDEMSAGFQEEGRSERSRYERSSKSRRKVQTSGHSPARRLPPPPPPARKSQGMVLELDDDRKIGDDDSEFEHY